MVKNRQLLEVSRAATNFALALYHKLSATPGNLVYSPVSITMALALMHAGAAGRTRDEIGQAMNLAGTETDLHDTLSNIAQRLRISTAAEMPSEEMFASGYPEELRDEMLQPPLELEIASGLWHRHDIEIRPAYADLVDRLYGVRPVGVDFEGAREQTCRIMNEWAHDKTRGLIPTIVESADIHPLARLFLANAVYFNSHWALKFCTEATKPHDFHCLHGGTARVDMMHLCAHFAYWESHEWQAAKLRYRVGTQSFLVVLPRPGRFEVVQESLDATFVRRLTKPHGGRSRKVLLGLPRFRIGQTLSLKDILADLGIRRLFTDDADLSAMSATPDLQLGDISHMVHVSVDEEGTQAAAVTLAALIGYGPGTEEPVEMIADRPFLFLIVDEETESILFAGHVVSP